MFGDLEQRPQAINARLLNRWVLASVPALLAGLWAVGDGAAGLFLPRLAVAMLLSFGWAVAFARLRGRAIDPGWFFHAWFFVLLLPAAIPLHMVVIGLSFGLVFGCHALGGTGRYIVNPALLGLVFLAVSYPVAMDSHWRVEAGVAATWSLVAAGGLQDLHAAGLGWLDVVLGRQVAALGAASALACLAGGLVLLAWRVASPAVFGGALLGLAAAGALAGDIPWYWQPAVGSFVFAAAFIANDPTTLPLSPWGRWLTGIVFGVLTVVIRVFNPEHPEGTGFALLLALLVAPLVDHLAVRQPAGGSNAAA